MTVTFPVRADIPEHVPAGHANSVKGLSPCVRSAQHFVFLWLVAAFLPSAFRNYSTRLEQTPPIRFVAKSEDRCEFFKMDPRGFPITFPEFQRVFPDDESCARYLEHLRWPNGFICPKCGNIGEPYRFSKRTSVVLRYRACHTNVSLTAATAIQSHAIVCVVLGRLPRDDADTRAVCSPVSAPTRLVPL